MSKRRHCDSASPSSLSSSLTNATSTNKRRTIQRSLRQPFTYTPLADPEKQIRLLRFLPHDNDQDMNLEITTWNIGNTPEYVAISYAWGTRRYKDIQLNGMSLRVRKNSHYALWQTRLHYPETYVWMDAVCIAQTELKEKGHQVRIMGSIFEAASTVVACVGDHKDGSELLVEAAIEMIEQCGLDGSFWPKERRLHEYASLFDEDLLALLLYRIQDFFDRPYFSRLWIVQELAAGFGRVTFMCGSNAIRKQDIDDLQELCSSVYHDMSHGQAAYENIWNVQVRSMTLNDIFVLNSRRQCYDVRDRVYGILSLIEWDNRGPLVIPDYSITPFTLALTVSQHMNPFSLYRLLQSLHISRAEPTIDAWTKRRMMIGKPVIPFGKPTENHSLDFFATCLKLQAGSSGSLTGLMYRNRSYDTVSTAQRFHYKESLQSLARSADPLVTYKNVCNITDPSNVCAVICDLAMPGDILMPLDGGVQIFADSLPLLVLRMNASGTYDVVGQCVCLPEYVPVGIEMARQRKRGKWRNSNHPKSIDPSKVFEGHIHLSLSIEDYMVLIGQSATGSEGGEDEYDPKWWFRRLATNPLLYPKGAVTITPVASTEESSEDTDSQRSETDGSNELDDDSEIDDDHDTSVHEDNEGAI